MSERDRAEVPEVTNFQMSQVAQTTAIQRLRWVPAIALTLAAVVLLQGLVSYLSMAYKAIGFVDELDYGEGIVWQQVRMIMSGDGYGLIDGLPAIVFHYPPVYHVSTAVMAAAIDVDQLAAGRLLSLLSTALVAILATVIVKALCRGKADNLATLISAALTALMIFSLSPVVSWSMLMRVDMLALAFSFAGVCFGLRALSAPRAVHLAALCFVLAVYTKQTAIAAPAAVFATLLYLRPRTALAGLFTAGVTSFAILAALAWSTDGGFLRHILWYNVNRFYPERLLFILGIAWDHALYLAVAVAGVMHRLRTLMANNDGSTGGLRQRLNNAPEEAGYIVMLAYAAVTTVLLGMIAKSGSSINYFLEWTCVICVLAGLALHDASRAAIGTDPPARFTLSTLFLPFAVAIQAIILADVPERQGLMDTSRHAQLRTLHELVHQASAPIISDNMVLLLRNDKEVQWEPAIFAELASIGLWDEKPFIEKIQAGAFAFFITAGVRGEPLFDSRYNPAVANAMDARYPRKRTLAGYTLHLPAKTKTNSALRP